MLLFPYAHLMNQFPPNLKQKLMSLGESLNSRFPSLKLPYGLFTSMSGQTVTGSALDYNAIRLARQHRSPWSLVFEMYGRNYFDSYALVRILNMLCTGTELVKNRVVFFYKGGLEYVDELCGEKGRRCGGGSPRCREGDNEFRSHRHSPHMAPLYSPHNRISIFYKKQVEEQNQNQLASADYNFFAKTRGANPWTTAEREAPQSNCMHDIFTPVFERDKQQVIANFVPVFRATIEKIAGLEGWTSGGQGTDTVGADAVAARSAEGAGGVHKASKTGVHPPGKENMAEGLKLQKNPPRSATKDHHDEDTGDTSKRTTTTPSTSHQARGVVDTDNSATRLSAVGSAIGRVLHWLTLPHISVALGLFVLVCIFVCVRSWLVDKPRSAPPIGSLDDADRGLLSGKNSFRSGDSKPLAQL